VDTRLRLAATESDEESRRNQGLQLGRNDIVLLCTDGLTDMVRDDEILRLITMRKSLGSAAEGLVERANRHGGRDNITVVLIGAPQPTYVVRRVGDLVRRVIRV
jgi:serine/threonine protein phosphatase PrpC